VLDVLLDLVFPRDCIGCAREGVLLCSECARVGSPDTCRLGGLEVRSCLPYAGTLRAAITEFKHGRRAFAGDLAAILAPFVDASMTLVPVPTTPRRRAERGFDQTVVLARRLQRTCGVRVAEMLGRRGSAAQHGGSRAQRLAATGRFCVRRKPAASVGRLVLFDDVRTTGATLVDAAAALDRSGLHVADALTLAWTPKEHQ
jgi:predicted amidophosphoribosyltransferase